MKKRNTAENRKYYEQLFAEYPDVVSLVEFRKMLGGIAESTALKLMHEKRVKYFYIRTSYLIPKPCVIDYILSDHYAKYKENLKVKI